MAVATDQGQHRDLPTPVVVFLDGKRRGRTQRLSGERISIGTQQGACIRLPQDELPADLAQGTSGDLAVLERRGLTYQLRGKPGVDIWVNGEPTSEIVLASGDVLEIGEGGPVLRFRLYQPGTPAYKSMREAFSDCLDCARYSDRGIGGQTALFLAGSLSQLGRETSPKVRLTLLLVLIVIVFGLGWMWFKGFQLQRRLESELARVQGMADLVQKVEPGVMLVPDRQAELESRLSQSLERIEALESRLAAPARVITAASRSVVFLQAGYGFLDPETGAPLRFAGAEANGQPLTDPQGNPLMTLEGEGPEVIILLTGTGFVASKSGLVITNRHIATPWEADDAARQLVAMGLQPQFKRLIGYLPGLPDSFELSVLNLSESSDVALLQAQGLPPGVEPLAFATALPEAGDNVVVLGYPAGIQALLARIDPTQMKAIVGEGKVDFWSVVQRLSSGGHISPLASEGIVGQVSSSAVVYDAETTHGGSGGPVLDMEGRVVAVNAAGLETFGGSNIGVPAAQAISLIDQPVAAPQQ